MLDSNGGDGQVDIVRRSSVQAQNQDVGDRVIQSLSQSRTTSKTTNT